MHEQIQPTANGIVKNSGKLAKKRLAEGNSNFLPLHYTTQHERFRDRLTVGP